MRLPTTLLALALLLGLLAAPRAMAIDDAHWQIANDSIDAGIEYLLETQNEDGSWLPEPGPAVTGLALTALLDHPEIDADHPAAAKAIEYILAHVQDDGSIRNGPDGILANYNTALCLSALSRVYNNPDVAAAIAAGQDYLRGTQWIVGMTDPNGDVIDENHPYVGGFGYGKHGRPDLSNTQIALQAMHDTGCDCDDPAFQRALVFLQRTQAIESNDLYADQINLEEGNHGGFIYAPSLNSDNINTPESKADPDQMDEALEGAEVSNLRTYGGMTYSGFKTLLYANLERDDPRVQAVLGWIAHNYELDHNPGMPDAVKLQGLYYYYLSMARALDAWGSSSVSVGAITLDGTFGTGDLHGEVNIPGGLPEGINRDRVVVQELVAFGISGVSVWTPLTSETLERLFGLTHDDVPDQVPAPMILLEIENNRTITGRILNEQGDDVLEDLYVRFTDTRETRDWGNDLIAKLASLQAEDGSWTNTESRWMEDSPILCTAYAVQALQAATD